MRNPELLRNWRSCGQDWLSKSVNAHRYDFIIMARDAYREHGQRFWGWILGKIAYD